MTSIEASHGDRGAARAASANPHEKEARVSVGLQRRRGQRWPRAQALRAGLEGIGLRHQEPEVVGEWTNRVEREADGERDLDLLSRDTGDQDRPHVIGIHRALLRQLAQHPQVALSATSISQFQVEEGETVEPKLQYRGLRVRTLILSGVHWEERRFRSPE